MNLNDYAHQCHSSNAQWWTDPVTRKRIARNKGELLCLIHSEISEAMEGERKSTEEPCGHCGFPTTTCRGLHLDDGYIWQCPSCREEHEGPAPNSLAMMDDKLPHRRMAEVELADALIRIFDYAGAFGYDLQGAYEEKRAYNASRPDHKIEHRMAEGGKKW
jgi:hypothetical protein